MGQDDDLDSIPMPSSSSSTSKENVSGAGALDDSWRRAQSALSAMGGGRPVILQTPSQSTANNMAQFSAFQSPYFQAFPSPTATLSPAYSASYLPNTMPTMPYSYFSGQNAGAGPRPSTARNPTFMNRFPRFTPVKAERQPTPYSTNMNQIKKVQSNFPQSNNPIKPIRFIISNNSLQNKAANAASNALSTNGSIPYPPAVRDYIERSYAATDEKDRIRLEKFLKDRVEPLLKSGAVYAVNWAIEPLPHEQNFQVHTSWTPASELKRNQPHTQPQLQSSSPTKVQSSPSARPSNSSTSSWFISLNGSPSSDESVKEISPTQKGKGPRAKTNITMDAGVVKQPTRKQKKKWKKGANEFTNAAAGACKSWTGAEAGANKRKSRARRFADETLSRASFAPAGGDGVPAKAARSRQSLEFFVDVRGAAMVASREDVDTDGDSEIVGTCMEVEKPFFRLTSAPDPSQIRPLPILLKALELVKKHYKIEQNYRYACDQLKSIRQDLMIQNIRNDFTVLVYESNARIALENKDREEFNQCQNQLKQLYAEVPSCPNKWEFTGYRLLYYIYMKDILDVSTILDGLLPHALIDECMGFALSVWYAWSMSNYVRLFRLYARAPKMSGYVMDMFVERERKEFFASIVKAYRPEIDLNTVAKWLAFSNTELCEWLSKLGITATSNDTIDCRQYANITF